MGGVVKAVTNIVKKVVNIIVDVVKSVIDFVGDVIGFVINPFGAFDTPTVDDPGAQAQGVQVTRQGTNTPIPLIYGYRRIGGAQIFAESNGTTNKYLYVVYALCEGEILGVNRIIVNDVDLPLPSGNVFANGTVVNVTAGRFANRIQFQCFNGTENQVQSTLANESKSWGTKARTLPGIAYVAMRFEWKEIKSQADADNNPFGGGIPNCKFDVFGKKVYDVRTHSGGADLSGSYSSRSKEYSFNPANCLLDYLENPRYGAGLPSAQIDADSFKIAANKFEQTVTYSDTQSGRALTMNAFVDTGQKIIDNVKALVAGNRGIMPFVQGRYKLKVEDGGHPTDITSSTVTVAYDVDKDNIVGGLNLDGERKSTKFNQVIVNYIDPDLNFTNQQVVYNSAGDQTIDNEEELTGEFTFHTITNKAMAYDLAQMIYDKSRSQKQLSFTATQELLDVEVGDIIRVTDTVLNLSNDTYRVIGVKLRNDGLLDIEAAEHDATIYPFTSGPQIELPAPLYLPDEFNINPFVRQLPSEPVSVVPPVDPDAPDTSGDGSGGGVLEENNPPADTNDNPVTAITLFEDFNNIGPNGFYYKGKSTSQLVIDSTTVQSANDSGIHYRVTDPAFSVLGLAKPINLGYVISLNMPVDEAVDQLVFQIYRDGSPFGNLFVYNVRQASIWSVYNPNTKQKERIEYISGWSVPMEINFLPGVSLQSDDLVKVYWRKSSLDMLFPDDSNIGQFDGFSYTYTDFDGSTKTGDNIEALLNYLKDLHYGSVTTSSSLVTDIADLGA